MAEEQAAAGVKVEKTAVNKKSLEAMAAGMDPAVAAALGKMFKAELGGKEVKAETDDMDELVPVKPQTTSKFPSRNVGQWTGKGWYLGNAVIPGGSDTAVKVKEWRVFKDEDGVWVLVAVKG